MIMHWPSATAMTEPLEITLSLPLLPKVLLRRLALTARTFSGSASQ